MKESINRIKKEVVLQMKKNQNLIFILSAVMTILEFVFVIYSLPYLDKMESRQPIAPFIIFILMVWFSILIDCAMIKILEEQISEKSVPPENK
ncbi:hypothetical protein [Pantoea agglomerans]|uniref:hypothetical protein n=1 Tax=Enterobacter agglomerans TaxID=549 RepID=UPI003C7C6642